jgi:DNA-binding CsgD family transcriptional regulator
MNRRTSKCEERNVKPTAALSDQADQKPKSPKLKLRQVREVFRLVGEVRELGAEPDSWRPHLVNRMCALLRAEIVTSSEIHFRKTRNPTVLRVLDVGWGTDATGTLWKIDNEQEDERPETYLLTLAHAPEGAADAGSRDMPLKPAQPMYGGSHFILSQVPLPHIWAVDQLGVHRGWGEEPFSAADHKLVRLFHLELGRLWRMDTVRRARDPRIALPPRLQQTLEALATGNSEKQIAAKLKLSQHTIHNYVKALHQRFNVSSRGELLARANKQKSDFTPRLTNPQG